MSFFHASTGVIQSAAGGVVTLSGQSVFDIDTGARLYRAALVISNTGIMQEITNGNAASQIDNATDWVIPNSVAPDDYECRFINRTGDSPNGSTNMVENVWIAVTPDRIIDQQAILAASDSRNTNFDLEIRKGSSGAAIATANYTLDIERII